MKAQMDHDLLLTEEEQETMATMFEYFFKKLTHVVEQYPAKAHALEDFEALKDKVFTALQQRELH